MTTNQQRVWEWHDAFNCPNLESPAFPSEDRIELRKSLITEEFHEVIEAIDEMDLGHAAKELGDLLWVVYGTGCEFGLDLDTVMEEIFRSNMSKLGEDGKPLFREDGKVLKGPNYTEANIEKVLDL